MKRYKVEMQREGSVKYFFIRDMETLEIVLLPSKYLMHQVRANRSPNTIRRNAFALAYYWEYLLEEEHEAEDVYGMDYETQYDFFAEYLKWLKAGKHTDNLDKEPQNKTCNAYLKEVFRFYSFLEVVRNNGSCLSVLSYNQPITKANAIGVRRTIRSRSFKGYLKEEERNVRAAERNEIVTILEACTNCRDQVLILLTSELGFRIGEILGIDYTKDIDYENHEIRVDFRDDNENDARAKNAEERRGRVSDDTFEFLLYYIGEYWDILQKQEYLFINIKGDTIGKPLRVDSVYDMFERMEKKTGIKITPHMLRRYYANTRWEADWPLEMISQALGHKHLDTTIRYLNVLDDNRSVNEDVYMEMIHKLPLFPEKPRLVFLHLWALGLRCNEVCTLKGNAYYMQGRDAWIQVYQYKMKNYKKVPIPLALYKLMKVYIRKNGILPEEYVFQNSTGGAYLYGTFRKQMMKYCEKYGIGDGTYQFKSHDYRHTLATMFYDNGTSIQSVRDYLGHDFEEMTQQYIDYMPKKISKANKEYLSKEENSLAAGIKRCKRGK